MRFCIALRRIIVLLVVLGLPVQGWASAVLADCPASVHSTAQSAGDAPDGHPHGPDETGFSPCSLCSAAGAAALPHKLSPAVAPAAAAYVPVGSQFLSYVPEPHARPPLALFA